MKKYNKMPFAQKKSFAMNLWKVVSKLTVKWVEEFPLLESPGSISECFPLSTGVDCDLKNAICSNPYIPACVFAREFNRSLKCCFR